MNHWKTCLNRLGAILLIAAAAFGCGMGRAHGAGAADYTLFARTNLAAWCIVPFDAKKRGPEERAAMLEKMGLRQFAYDYRAEHIPTFDAELEALERHHVNLLAWWFPTAMNDEAHLILSVLERHKIHAQLWVMGGGGPTKSPEEQRARVAAEADRIGGIAMAAVKIGCSVALYNHGSWFGEPENQIEIIELLRARGTTNVGIVYNLHHGHEHLERFPTLLQKMKPHLVALNLNGMTRDGERNGKKIMPIGQGDMDARLLKIIAESGWRGPVGVLNHTDEDAEARLLDNLDGLDWVVAQLQGKPVGPKPQPRSWKEPAPPAPTPKPSAARSMAPEFGAALSGGMVVEGRGEYRSRPLTIECWAKLESKAGFNIVVACDPKGSSEHWELYSYAGSGEFSAYQPGRGGEVKSGRDICDGQWHYLAAVLEQDRVRLYVDGKLMKEAAATAAQGAVVAGGLAFGRLVEGGIGCDGLVDNVRISRGALEIGGIPQGPLRNTAGTVGLWNFDETPVSGKAGAGKRGGKYWAVEDPAERAKLPLYQVIPAATGQELTAADGRPGRETLSAWTRSHGDNGGRRYSALGQINRQNVGQLREAWTYKSRDGSNNIQANPVIVKGVLFTPTPGKHLVAVNAATGAELWRFKPEGRPAFRGLTYWAGQGGAAERLFFPSGPYLYALDPKNGQPVAGFGKDGRIRLPGAAQGDFGAATAAPAVFESIVIVPGFEKDVWGFDAVSGAHLWTFHTVPQAGEEGYETWDRTEGYGANAWAGMALDDARGIAYVTTGSPKPNFIGVGHHGDNLFANCLIALDARTGRRLWHFQEIRHDIWDLDMSAPPNLSTITKEGRKIDVVAAVTKIGNTILLDRVSGKPIFPFRLRRAPTSDLPGEVTSPYQPDPELPERFSKQEFTGEDLGQRSEEAGEFAASRFKSATTGWFRPCSEGKPNLFLGIDGGAEWTGACVDQETGRLYVTANHVGWIISVFRDDEAPEDLSRAKTKGREVYEKHCLQCHGPTRLGLSTCPPLRGVRHRLTDAQVASQVRQGKNAMPANAEITEPELGALIDYLMARDGAIRVRQDEGERPSYTVSGYPKFYDAEGFPANKRPWGTLNCIDLNTGKLLWKRPHGEYPADKDPGVQNTGTENYGGAIVTAGGLVFCAGTRDSKIRAYDKDTGAELWSAKLPFVGNAPPSTYEVAGRQYLVVSASGGNKLGTQYGDAWVAFALP